MWIAEFPDYKKYLKALIKSYPGKGRGQASRLSEHLHVNRLVITQVLNHERHFTIDQTIEVSKFFGFDEMATDYFVLMVSHARAETKTLKGFYEKKMVRLKDESAKIKSNVQGKQVLNESDMGVFYSNWHYAAVSCLVSIDGYQTIESIANYFGMPRSRISEIVSFLISSGILKEEDGKILSGQTSTFVSEPSPFLHNHRRNWRLKAIESSNQITPADILVSIPVSISKKDSEAIRKELVQLVSRFSKLVKDSKEEQLMCLNIDWFKY